jgi:hypothetical protein
MDPSDMTSLVESLLKRRNRLRRAGNMDAANNLADRINKKFLEVRNEQFAVLSLDELNLQRVVRCMQLKENTIKLTSTIIVLFCLLLT